MLTLVIGLGLAFYSKRLVQLTGGTPWLRHAVNYAIQSAGSQRKVHLPAFVSISSPWNGHSAAAAGVKYAPVAAPSWKDMAPGSPFLIGLPQIALPPECEYTLLFSYRDAATVSG